MSRVRRIWAASLNLLVVVAVITMITAVVGAMGFLSQPGWTRRIAVELCVLVVLLGSASIVYQVVRLYRLDVARSRLSELLVEGQRFKNALPDHNLTAETKQQVNEWYSNVEDAVRHYLPEPYADRLEVLDFRNDPTTPLGGRIQTCLETITQFLSEIGGAL